MRTARRVRRKKHAAFVRTRAKRRNLRSRGRNARTRDRNARTRDRNARTRARKARSRGRITKGGMFNWNSSNARQGLVECEQRLSTKTQSYEKAVQEAQKHADDQTKKLVECNKQLSAKTQSYEKAVQEAREQDETRAAIEQHADDQTNKLMQERAETGKLKQQLSTIYKNMITDEVRGAKAMDTDRAAKEDGSPRQRKERFSWMSGLFSGKPKESPSGKLKESSSVHPRYSKWDDGGYTFADYTTPV